MRNQMLIENGIEIALIVDISAEPVECGICGTEGFHDYCVPWYCGPVLEGDSEGGYKTVCKSCHDKWAAWANQALDSDGKKAAAGQLNTLYFRRRKQMKQFDTRWITFPSACLLAVMVGDVSLWTISLVIIGCFPLFLKY